jgi:nucleotide sugar dehydrogenase
MNHMQTAIEPRTPSAALFQSTVAVVGLGYVGLPTGLALADAGFAVTGVDVNERRLEDIHSGHIDVIPEDRRRLEEALETSSMAFTSRERALSASDAVLICVPTPVDAARRPDLGALRAACASVVNHARPGQVLILTSTSHVGATRELLVEPLARRGLVAGQSVHVAFSPERIDPGRVRHPQGSVPRVIGGVTEACGEAATSFLGEIAGEVVRVSSPEAAELVKLHENTFRAVNIALANELAEVARAHHLDPLEIVEAAGTKPYGFMPFYPGPGVGGHCIPCDPHYLLEPLDRLGTQAPVVTEAMKALHSRPRRVIDRAVELLAADGIEVERARLLVVGVSYKPGVADVRESPGCEILNGLRRLGARVEYHDPRVVTLDADDGVSLLSVKRPDPQHYDLLIVTALHPECDTAWIADCTRVLDCTYRMAAVGSCHGL